MGTDTDWVAVACGAWHTVALKSDGSLWTWGYNGWGQLGLGDNTRQAHPHAGGTDTDWVAVACGGYHTWPS